MRKLPILQRQTLVLAGLIVVTFCAPLIGAFATPDEWFAALEKPAWNPPGWVFGPVWTVLYLMMAVAAWLVWRRRGLRSRAIGFYFSQLVLNAAWTPIFFGMHRLGWALLTIIALWFAILLTMRSFFEVSKQAGWMFVPYLAWVTFATFLNFTLWRLNAG